MNKKDTGEIGEKIAQKFLKKKGFRILETNFRCKEGEIDIIAEKNKCIVFTEVRSKTTINFGTPEESVTKVKRNHLINAALRYLNLHSKLGLAWRIDFIAVELTVQGKISRIEHIENAVSY